MIDAFAGGAGGVDAVGVKLTLRGTVSNSVEPSLVSTTMSLSPRVKVEIGTYSAIFFSVASRWSSASETSRPERVPEMTALLAFSRSGEQVVQLADGGGDLLVGIDAEGLDRAGAVVQRAHHLARGVERGLGEVVVGRRRRIELQRLLQLAERGGRRGARSRRR